MLYHTFQRGWTTWTTAAVDKRVIAQIPIEMSLLNFFKVNNTDKRLLGQHNLEEIGSAADQK